MTPFFMAIASSMFYGVADFMGGMSTRRAHVFTVTAWFQLTGVALLVGYALLAPGETRIADLAWAAGSGVAGGLGVTLLYHVLATGTVSTAAPLVSMIALTVPVIVGLVAGERLGVLPLAGIALGALAVWLVSGDASHGDGDRKSSSLSPLRPLGLAVLSGALIGGFLVLLSHVQPGSSGWPLVAGRASATVCLWSLVLIGRAPIVLARPAIAPMLGAAVTDVAGNVLYLLAVQRAPLSLTATLVSLAPATTVLLAQVVLREALSARQRVGVALALVAVVLLSRGG